MLLIIGIVIVIILLLAYLYYTSIPGWKKVLRALNDHPRWDAKTTWGSITITASFKVDNIVIKNVVGPNGEPAGTYGEIDVYEIKNNVATRISAIDWYGKDDVLTLKLGNDWAKLTYVNSKTLKSSSSYSTAGTTLLMDATLTAV